MKKILFAAALGATIVSTAAMAQEREGRDMTRQDAQAMADAMFQRFDLNHDGTVTRQEVDQARSAMGNGGGKRVDKMVERIFGDSQSITMQQFVPSNVRFSSITIWQWHIGELDSRLAPILICR